MDIETARNVCQKFANDHKLIFEDEGECGFGRECVGFETGGNWVDHNPYDKSSYMPIEEFECDDCYAPTGVNAYHKHDCLAVLGRGDEAIIQLADWVKNLESKGTVKVHEYQTGATGIQAIMSGLIGKCVMVHSS